VWDILKESDQDTNNPDHVILIYSGRSLHKEKNSGKDNSNPDYWNREHVWSKSHGFKKQSFPAYSDVHHIRPADASINRSRGNLDFDEGGKPHQEAPKNRLDNDSWEPRNAVKGDVARMMFYMAVRYEGDVRSEPDLKLINKTGTYGPYFGKLCTLLEWHAEDPVDAFELRRNEVIYSWQKNRNPFIDRPEFAARIWGDRCH